mmetsp:Transcript_25146/g.64067  ORF Transcript_25146/g.64067 Transcript_25146/m.64067 type:complete len:224 (-) Transcript_25146:417-1088(-)
MHRLPLRGDVWWCPQGEPDVQVQEWRSHDRRLPRAAERLPGGRPGQVGERPQAGARRGRPHAGHGLHRRRQDHHRQDAEVWRAADGHVQRHLAQRRAPLGDAVPQGPSSRRHRLYGRRFVGEHLHPSGGSGRVERKRQAAALAGAVEETLHAQQEDHHLRSLQEGDRVVGDLSEGEGLRQGLRFAGRHGTGSEDAGHYRLQGEQEDATHRHRRGEQRVGRGER